MKGALIVLGVFMLGFILPEALAAIRPLRVPLAMNFWIAFACAIIATAVML